MIFVFVVVFLFFLFVLCVIVFALEFSRLALRPLPFSLSRTNFKNEKSNLSRHFFDAKYKINALFLTSCVNVELCHRNGYGVINAVHFGV